MPRRRACALVAALIAGVALATAPSVALAADPPGTGINNHGATTDAKTPAAGGYTLADVQAKEAALASMIKSQGSLLAYQASARLSGFTPYHQKTNYQCLPATIQSIAHYLGFGWITPSVQSAQATIAAAVGTDPDDGTFDHNALNWLNNQAASHGDPWRYVGQTPATLDDFRYRVNADVVLWAMPTYLRVDLSVSTRRFKYFQAPKANGDHVLHATYVTGYRNSLTNIEVADPLTYATVSGTVITCHTGSFPGNDQSCTWGRVSAAGKTYADGAFSTSQYWTARDQTSYANGEYVLWW